MGKTKLLSSLQNENSVNKVVLIDCVDSFTYLLQDLFIRCGAECSVQRHSSLSIQDATHLVIGPGPGHPDEYPHLKSIIESNSLPLLGICLGHQLIAQTFGGKIVRAQKAMHGKKSLIHHQNRGLFKDIEKPMTVGRYHSLIAQLSSLPETLSIDATSPFDEIMALSHISRPIFGLQFHPESFLTKNGEQLIRAFLT